MYPKLIAAVLACLICILLAEGLPGLMIDLKNMLPSGGHSSQYNLVFWLMLAITAVALLKPKGGGQP